MAKFGLIELLFIGIPIIAGAIFVYTQKCNNSFLRKYLCKGGQTFDVDLPSGGKGTAIHVTPEENALENREASKVNPNAAKDTAAHFKMLEGIKAGRASAYRARSKRRHYGY